MPSMTRGYNAKGESKAFENGLPEGWEQAPILTKAEAKAAKAEAKAKAKAEAEAEEPPKSEE